MARVNITIDGQPAQAQSGQTVLEAARSNGVDIPVLCHHPALPPEGACRVCLVEVEKQRGLQPACTFPVTEGMVVHTESERVVAARKFVLELLFSERIHYCMYCAVSGSDTTSQCELQRLAYRYGLTSWRYPPNTSKRWPVDASRKHFIMDHSRCILCRRCIRACDQVVANHTLGLRDRGSRTMVIADDGVPFGASTCVSCGTCLQVCPTGALIDRRSAYMGGQGDFTHTLTTCLACPVGCGIDASTRSNTLVKVNGDWDASNGGLLCVHGRFEVVEPQPGRITTPLMRRDDAWAQVSWDEAISVVANRLQASKAVAGLASPRSTNEELAAFRSLFDKVPAHDQVGLIYGQMPPTVGQAATLDELSGADCIVVVSGRPLDDQKVVAYVARRTAEQGARLIVVSDEPTALEAYARKCYPLSDIGQAVAEAAAAERPVVLYAAGLAPAIYEALRALPAQARVLPLYKGTNTAGAAKMGLAERPVTGKYTVYKGDALFVLAGDEIPDGHNLPEASFTVIQAAYRTRWTEAADVILPALIWSEKQGHIVNIEGRELPVVAFLQPPAGVPADAATLAGLAERLAR